MIANSSEIREELAKLEKKHVDNPDGRFFVPLANAYRKAGEIDKAVALLEDGLERNQEYLSAHIVLGRCLVDRGDISAAAREFEYVLELDPQNLIALRTLGEIAVASGSIADAHRWYDRLLSVDPMNDDARRALEQLKGAEGAPHTTAAEGAGQQGSATTAGASADVVSGRDAPPSHEGKTAVVTETIAELYTRQGFYDRAADVYRELIRRRGGDAGLQERLDRVEKLARSVDAEDEETVLPVESDQEPEATPGEADEVESAGGFRAVLDGPEAGRIATPVDRLETDSFFPESEEEREASSIDPVEAPVAHEEPVAANPMDSFSSSFSSGFGGDDLDPEDGGSLTGDISPAPESHGEPAHNSIGEYLTEVLSWRPSGPERSTDMVAPPAPPEASPRPPVAEPRSELPYGTVDLEAGVRPESAEATLSDEPVAPPLTGMIQGYQAGVVDLNDEPAMEPPPAENRADLPTAEAPASPPAEPAIPEVADPEPLPAAPAAADPLPPPSDATPPASESAASSGDAVDEDEDLESFQEWLRSLKR